MGVYRHAIAQTIVMLLWITKSNIKKQFLIVLAAMTFHIAAAISFLALAPGTEIPIFELIPALRPPTESMNLSMALLMPVIRHR